MGNKATGSWKQIFTWRMLFTFVAGFSSGLPFLLTGGTLQAWLKGSGVDIKTIGLFSLVGLPYTIKFLWSPVMDTYTPWLGRRRGWAFITQVALALSIALLGFTNPVGSLTTVAIVAILVTFFSASQDIVLDAWRRESLRDEELGFGSSLFVNGYRIGMLLAGNLALIMADHLPWSVVYAIMGGAMAIGLLNTLLAPEPVIEGRPPRTLREGVIEPLKEYFTREGAWLFLAFILLYKMGDIMAAAMLTPFYLDLGFTKTDIGAIAKTAGLASVIAGGFIGGALMIRIGIRRSLWIFGLLQAAGILAFAALAQVGQSYHFLVAAIGIENLTAGMGTAAYIAFMASLTNKRFTATQYALLSSLMGIPRVILSAPMGYAAAFFGWTNFFIFCTVAALPGLFLLTRLPKSEID